MIRWRDFDWRDWLSVIVFFLIVILGLGYPLWRYNYAN